MSFATNLENARKDLCLNQTQLGNALGLSQQMISNYENGLTCPPLDILIKISDFFHITIDTLVNHELTLTGPTISEFRFLKYFRFLNNYNRLI